MIQFSDKVTIVTEEEKAKLPLVKEFITRYRGYTNYSLNFELLVNDCGGIVVVQGENQTKEASRQARELGNYLVKRKHIWQWSICILQI